MDWQPIETYPLISDRGQMWLTVGMVLKTHTGELVVVGHLTAGDDYPESPGGDSDSERYFKDHYSSWAWIEGFEHTNAVDEFEKGWGKGWWASKRYAYKEYYPQGLPPEECSE